MESSELPINLGGPVPKRELRAWGSKGWAVCPAAPSSHMAPCLCRLGLTMKCGSQLNQLHAPCACEAGLWCPRYWLLAAHQGQWTHKDVIAEDFWIAPFCGKNPLIRAPSAGYSAGELRGDVHCTCIGAAIIVQLWQQVSSPPGPCLGYRQVLPQAAP